VREREEQDEGFSGWMGFAHQVHAKKIKIHLNQNYFEWSLKASTGR